LDWSSAERSCQYLGKWVFIVTMGMDWYWKSLFGGQFRWRFCEGTEKRFR
jgi:hypothetical protein